MHPYYGVNHLQGATPTLMEAVDSPESLTSPFLGPEEGIVMPMQNQEPLQHPVPSDSAVGSSVMNNLGSSFNFPSPQQGSYQQYGHGIAGASGSINGGPHGQFHFFNPTFSGAPIQMVAPAAGMQPPSMWQLTVPSTMPWAVPSCSSLQYPSTPLSSAVAATVAAAASVDVTPTITQAVPRNRTSTPGLRHSRRKTKRKATLNDEVAGSKVFINENRMVERMEQLQLDNNNLQWHPNLEEEDWYARGISNRHGRPTLGELDSRLSVSDEEDNEEVGAPQNDEADVSGPRLELCEVLQMGLRTKEILPKVLLDEMNKPCMQIVLWKPPGNHVQDVLNDVTKAQEAAQVAGMPSGAVNSDMSGVGVEEPDQTFINGLSNTNISPSVWGIPAGRKNSSSGKQNSEEDDMDL